MNYDICIVAFDVLSALNNIFDNISYNIKLLFDYILSALESWQLHSFDIFEENGQSLRYFILNVNTLFGSFLFSKMTPVTYFLEIY